MKLSEQYRVWAEIDLDVLAENYRKAQQIAGGALVMPIIKADAYGHGAVMAAKTLSDAPWFGVATPEEALELRQNGIGQEILLLGACPVGQVSALRSAGITLCLSDADTARLYLSASGASLPRMKVHIKLDTGMSRLGVLPQDALREVTAILDMPDIRITGLFTHFAMADNLSSDFTAEQARLFDTCRKELCKIGLFQPLCHAANSAALLSCPETRYDMVRAGIILYGSNPLSGDSSGFRPVMELKTTVVRLMRIPKGGGISYGHIWRAARDSVIATVPIGYADGLSRRLSGRVSMLLRGKKVPQVGRICMDMCMLDVTDLPDACVGDIVTVIGKDHDTVIPAEEHAEILETIPYEIFCAVGRRVSRVYKENGQFF